MASLLELGISTGKWDAGLRKAQGSLNNFIQAQGGLTQAIDKENAKIGKFVGMMGNMTSSAKTAKGQMKDYKGALEQLTAQYNQLTEAQKKTIGPEYLASIDKLKTKFREAKTQVDDFNRSLNGIDASKLNGGGLFGGGKLDGMLQVFGGNLMTKAAGFGAGLAMELGDAVKQGIELARQGEGIRIAFERLGRGDILDGLRQATHGTVTDIELMKAAVKFNDFKLPLDELGTMLAFAQQKAKDTGQSVDYMVDSIVTGLGRKSLMILDNLGLSAAEIRDKMQETGDMTKAVGAIIREQMSKAGDYIETAADRATKANVEVQNAMERLGETFQPLTDSANSMWTDIKVGAIDLLNNAVKPLIKALKEAGTLGQNARNNAGYENLGGDAKVNRLIAKLGDGKGTKAFRTYKAQLAEFDRYANSLKFKIAAFGDDKSGIAQSAVAKLQTELAGVYAMRMEYDRRAQELHKKTTAKNVDDNKEEEQSIDSLKTKLKDLQDQRKKAIAAGDTELSKKLLKQINQVKTDIKGLGGNTTTTTTHPKTELENNQAKIKALTQEYIKLGDTETEASIKRQEEIKKEIALLEQRNSLIGLRTEQAQGKLLGGDINTSGLATTGNIIDRSHLFDIGGGINWQVLQKYNDQSDVSEFKWKKKERDKSGKGDTNQDEKVVKDISTITGAVGNIMGGIQSLGLELPEGVTQAIGMMQTISGILTAILTITTAINATQEVQTAVSLIPGMSTGGVVRAAQGTVVPGNFGFDAVPALLTSGEVVLNKAQQGALASELQDSGINGLHIVGEVEGEKIILVANRTFTRRGEGEIVTWKN
jgi:hypothetical protein